MPSMMMSPEFRIYALCCVVLVVNLQLLAGMTAAKRNKVKQFINPEDSKVNFGGASKVDGAEHPDVARILRAHRNALENIPSFFAIGLIYVLAGASPLGAKICMLAFTVTRVLHSIVYLNAAQPWRTIMFAIGSLALMAMAVMIVLAAVAAM